MKTLILTITLLAGVFALAIAQGKKSVVIGTMVNKPNAILVINPPNKDQGFLLPQLTSSERLAIAPSSPGDDGLVVYDLTDKSFYYWSGGSWIKGLGDNTTQSLAYDAATQSLSLTGGGTISLSTLKEIPSTTGQAGNYLTTDGTTLTWATLGTIGDITSIITGQGLTGGATSGDINLSVNTDGTTISVNGSNQLQLSNGAVTAPKLAANAVNSSHIIDASITGTDILDNTISTNDLSNASVTGGKIANGTVTTTNISSGGNNKVLSTDGTGAVTWADRSTFDDDNQNLILAGNTLNIDNGASANLNTLTTAGDVAGALNSQVIQPNAVNSGKIQDGSIATTDLSSPGNNKVLITDGTGLVNWADRSTFTDDNQNLSFSGNTLSIDNGTPVNLSANGQVTGLLDNLVIQPGTSNQVLVTNAAGTASTWVTAGGDVTGAVNTTTVGKIQGRNVSNAAPNTGDALIWNGIAWVPTVVTPAPTTQFYAVDPLHFQGSGSPITAGVNLPDGATITGVVVYYEYTLLLGVISVNFSRKEFATGTIQDVSFGNSPLLGLGIQNIALPVNVARDLIDNSTYSYRITVSFTLPATQDIHGIRIQYTK